MYYALLLILVVVVLPWFFLIKPAKANPERTAKFKRYRYAHRGLYTRDGQVPENSMTAFKLAVYKRCGIEMDLQLTRDGQVVVFHDDDLMRMCGVDRKISELTYEELMQYSLLKSEEKIPLFTEVLAAVDGKAPLILELKATDADPDELCEKTVQALKGYKGLFCVESFHPFIVKWFRRHEPQIVRGQLSMNFMKSRDMSLLTRFAATYLLANCIGKPDFIAYSYEGRYNLSLMLCRSFYKVFTIGWTVSDTYYYQVIKRQFDTVIFEFIDPA